MLSEVVAVLNESIGIPDMAVEGIADASLAREVIAEEMIAV